MTSVTAGPGAAIWYGRQLDADPSFEQLAASTKRRSDGADGARPIGGTWNGRGAPETGHHGCRLVSQLWAQGDLRGRIKGAGAP
jgi:hypothetical protein